MSRGEATTIPRPTKIFYATYANFPTSGLIAGDCAYATDRLVFYRWSGAAWNELTIHSSSGVAANIPTAADLPAGSIYFETDTAKLKQIQAGAWVEVSYDLGTVLTADGDIYIRSGGAVTRLAKGSDGEILELVSGMPSWQTKPSKLAFTDLVGGDEHKNAASTTWQDWDLSGVIGAGATHVLIAIDNITASILTGGVRKNGTALARLAPLSPYKSGATERWMTTMIVACDASRIIETYAETWTNIVFNCLGYWS